MGELPLDRRILGKNYFLPLVIAIVIAVSWVGVFDEYSDNYTDDSIIQAGTSYAIEGVLTVLYRFCRLAHSRLELAYLELAFQAPLH